MGLRPDVPRMISARTRAARPHLRPHCARPQSRSPVKECICMYLVLVYLCLCVYDAVCMYVAAADVARATHIVWSSSWYSSATAFDIELHTYKLAGCPR